MRGKNTASKRANLKQQDIHSKNRVSFNPYINEIILNFLQELRKEEIEKKKEKRAGPVNKNIPKALSRFK